MTAPCPTPTKLPMSKRAAKAALRRMQRERHEHGRLSVYACGWHWHVGHVQYPHLRAAASPRIGRVA
jgi:hypothetical protein